MAATESKKSYISADDFLSGVTGEELDFDVPGLGMVKIRSLTTREVGKINREADGDPGKMMAMAVRDGLVEPQLSGDVLAVLNDAKPGPIADISRRIIELSGMSEEAEALEDLAGGGS